MKEVSGCEWMAKLSGAILIMFLALPTYAQLMLAHEGHHDAGGCEIKGGEFPMTFSGYEVPEGDIPPMHSYCSNIPTPGKVQLTIELPDWDSREIPLAVRLVEAGHKGHDSHKGHDVVASDKEGSESKTEDSSGDTHDHKGHEMDGEHANHDDSAGDPGENDIIYMPYEPHKSGIIVVSAELQKGNYEILLERKDEAGDIAVAGRVPFAVGGSGGGHAGHGGGFGMMEIGLLVIVAGGAAFFFMRRKKAEEESKR